MIKHIHRFVWATLILATGCQVGPPYEPPLTEVTENWKNEQACEAPNPTVCNWWEIFEDSTLDTLEEQALANNNDLYAALQRVIQARAMAGVAESALYPQLTLGPNYSNQDLLTKIFIAKPPIPPVLREHQITNLLPLNLSYELDLWGELLSTYQSVSAYADMQVEALNTLLLLLTSDLANSYFRLRTFDKEIALFLETIQTRKAAVDITKSRYEGKLVNFSDVSRAKLDLSNVEADYYEGMRQREIEVNRIAVLIGTDPSTFELPSNPLAGIPPAIPAAMPSTVVRQRPDIAEAEREMASQHALVRVAYANYFPTITLTGALGYSSPDLQHFLRWESRLWSLGASALQTVFDGGRTDYNLTAAWAQFNGADAAYKQQVLIAFQEVEDALSDIAMLAKQSEKLAESVEDAKTTAKISQDRYFQGVTFYLDVMDSQRDELTSERNYISLQGRRYAATIQLVKAIGGSW